MKRVKIALLALALLLWAVQGRAEGPVDLDLSVLSGTVVYAQVFDMTQQPESYDGLMVRAKGNFDYYRDQDTGKEYFAVIIADATGCCAEGIEFEWAGEHTYPQDYPPLDTTVTITGRFSSYEEYGYAYLRLVDASLTWDAA